MARQPEVEQTFREVAILLRLAADDIDAIADDVSDLTLRQLVERVDAAIGETAAALTGLFRETR